MFTERCSNVIFLTLNRVLLAGNKFYGDFFRFSIKLLVVILIIAASHYIKKKRQKALQPWS